MDHKDADSPEPLEQIAIIGLSGRFPGAGSVDEFWKNLAAGVEARTEFSDADLAGKVAPELLHNPNYIKAGFILDGVDQFDAHFFNFTDRQAEITDPQQRLFLECACEALESAGIDVTRTESLIGIYAGASQSTYAQEQQDASLIHSLQTLLANDKDYLTTQAAYRLNLRGPCVTVQTACSTGLVAVHLGCQSLLNHECDVVLAGAVTVRLPQCGYLFEEGAIWSPDGHCRVFDQDAKGTVFGNGVGVVVLKRLSEALADGDPIWAVIRGSAVNNDGARKSSFTTSSRLGQMEVISEAWAVAGIEPESISYVETHGTGTAVGDPIEAQTLASLFSAGSARCAIGSVKSNVGHLETAAGIAGLIKTVMALHHRQIPPSLHFRTPNPEIDFERIPLYVNTTLVEWPADQGPRRAGISSFGIGGTNAHVVLEEAPERPAPVPTEGKQAATLLTLSAKTEEALRASAEAYRTFLATNPDLDLGDLCHTTHVGRAHHSHRLAVAGNSVAELQNKLAAYLAEGFHTPDEAMPKLAFLFTGQGAQYTGMGRDLYSRNATFRRELDRCAEILRDHLDVPLLDLLHEDVGGRLDQTTYTQPALFALEVALARLWLSWGMRPDILLGHSVGELAAACVAGVFSLEDGLALVAARARLMGALPQTGEMVALRTDEARLRAAIAAHGGGAVAVATVNGPHSVVLSGERDAVRAITAGLEAEGIPAQRLNVSHAFHSPLMEPMLDAFGQVAAGITYHPPRLAIVSNLTGRLAGDEIATPGYWVRHVREAVRFGDGLATLRELGITACLEVGPKPVLLGMLGQEPDAPLALPSLRENRDGWRQMMESLGQLYVHGAAIDWAEIDRGQSRRKLVLPTYPFQRRRYWIAAPSRPHGAQSLRPLIDRRIPLPHLRQTVFEKTFSTETLPFLADHHVYGEVVVPGACHLSLALSGADLLFGDGPHLIEDVIFLRALVLPKATPRTVQMIAETAGGPFQILSFAEGEEPIQHVSGRLTRLQQSPPGLHPEELQARCPQALTPQAVYDCIAAGQVDLGPTFRWFDALWQGEPGEAMARFRAPEALTDLRGYPLFPSLVDAAFQLAAAATLGEEDSVERDGTLLPFALERLAFHGPAQPAEMWGHARRQDADNWDITLFATDGAVIAELRGFRLREVPTSAIQGNRVHSDWLNALEWEPAADEPPSAPPAPDAWLLAGCGDGLEQTLFPDPPAALLRAADPAALRAVLADAASRHRSLGVVYLGHSDAGSVPEAARALGLGLLDLAQALLDSPLAIRLWIVTRGAQVLPGDLPPGGDRAAAGGVLWGLGRTLALEQPQWNPACIDLDPALPLAEQSEALRRELREAPAPAQSAWRRGTRYQARLKPWSGPPRDPSEAPLRPDASYLITGGLGGLGLEIARQMVADGARHLVLSGRRGVTEEAQRQALEELAQAGTEVVVHAADIGDRDEVRALLKQCDELAPLGGIVHAAGVLDDGVIGEQSPERFDRVMRPKVEGSWHLHSLTLGQDLDFFVCFSSAAAVLGSAGQSNYAAANAFVDSLMQQRRLAGLPGTSIAWGAWSEVGMAARLLSRRAMKIPTVPPAQGRLLFRHLLVNPPSETVVVLPWQETEQSAPSTNRSPGAVFDRQAYLGSAPEERVARVAEILRGIVTAIGGYTPDQLDDRQSLIDLGMDSLMVIELRNRANAAFDVLIPVSVFLDNGSIELLAPYLVAQLDAEPPAQSAVMREAPAAPQAQPEVETPYEIVEGEL